MMIGNNSDCRIIIPPQATKMERYYRVHSHIYDATRWSFLFGRRQIIEMATAYVEPCRILEIGCGTGANLALLAETFPAAAITGVDIADPMLAKARHRLQKYGQRIELLKYDYSAPLTKGGYDLILFSYTLTMINPGWQDAVAAAARDLRSNGCIAVVDFHCSRRTWFTNWMSINHVRMNAHLLPVLEQQFEPWANECHPAYLGLWQYFGFIGGKKTIAKII